MQINCVRAVAAVAAVALDVLDAVESPAAADSVRMAGTGRLAVTVGMRWPAAWGIAVAYHQDVIPAALPEFVWLVVDCEQAYDTPLFVHAMFAFD